MNEETMRDKEMLMHPERWPCKSYIRVRRRIDRRKSEYAVVYAGLPNCVVILKDSEEGIPEKHDYSRSAGVSEYYDLDHLLMGWKIHEEENPGLFRRLISRVV